MITAEQFKTLHRLIQERVDTAVALSWAEFDDHAALDMANEGAKERLSSFLQTLMQPDAQLAAAQRDATELRQEANSAGDVLLEAGFPDDAPLWQDIKQLAVQRDSAWREAAEAQALVKRYRIACTEHMFGADSPIIKAIDDEVGEIGFHALADAIEQARREERKACAKVADDSAAMAASFMYREPDTGLADAIRARNGMEG